MKNIITIDFEFEHEHGTFRDAIVLPEDHNLSDAQLEAMKQKRFDDWKLAVAPSEEEGEK